MKVDKFNFMLLQGVCLSVIVFAILRLIASMFVVRSTWWGVLGYGFTIGGLWLCFEYMAIRLPSFWRRYEILFLMGVCFLVHLCLIRVLPSLGRNEWATSVDYQYAVKSLLAGKICHIHREIYTYWCNYEIVLSTLAVLFGGRLELGQMVNACSCVGVVGLCFTLVKNISGIRIARLTALVIGLSPALVMASTLLTGEFLSATFMFMAFYFLLQVIDEMRLSKRMIAIVFSGCMLGISYLFKPITNIFIVAIITVCLLRLSYLRRYMCFCKGICLFLLFCLSYTATRNIGQNVLSELSASPKLKQINTEGALVYELALGLNIPSTGRWEHNLAVSLKKMSTCEMKEYLKNAIIRDWRGYPKLMAKKFVNLHGSHNEYVGIVQHFTDYFRKRNEKAKGWRDYWTRYIPLWVEPLSDAGMIVFEVLFLFGAIGLLFSLRKPLGFWGPGVISGLIVIGFAIIEQLIEVAGRYKIVVYPFYFMVIPYVCVWFEKDNPLYVRICGVAKRLSIRATVETVIRWFQPQSPC